VLISRSQFEITCFAYFDYRFSGISALKGAQLALAAHQKAEKKPAVVSEAGFFVP